MSVDHLLQERPDRLLLHTFNQLVTRPPAPWLVRGLLRTESVTLLYGKWGSYKTFVALDIAASIASGEPWHGHEIAEKGLVIYVAAEGGGGMVQRARAWLQQHNLYPGQVNMRFVVEPAIVTAESDDVEILINRIQEAIGWEDEGFVDPETGVSHDHPVAREWPSLIVIDTLARCFFGDENKQEDMGQFIQGIDRLKREFNSSILIVHHTGRDTSHERGSSALPGACDTIYRLDADDTKCQLALTCEKMKDGRQTDKKVLGFSEIEVTRRACDDPKETLTSIVLGQVDLSLDEDLTEGQRKILELLRDSGPLRWLDIVNGSGYSEKLVSGSTTVLVKRGLIVKENGMYRVPTVVTVAQQ